MKVLLDFYQAPGDTVVSTAAVASLMEQHPGRFTLAVRGTAAHHVFLNNPHVLGFDGPPDVVVRMSNPLIHSSHLPIHCLSTYCRTLSDALGVPVELRHARPLLYLSEQELGWIPRVEEVTGERRPYWVVCRPGAKKDYTVKRWPHARLQAVLDALPRVWIQVGESAHDHPPLRGAINEVGRTDTRQLIRMIGHPLCQGVLTGESLVWQLAAAFQKPAVCVASGWIPRSWVDYPTGQYLTRLGCLPCCRTGACWRSRVVPLGDGDGKDKSLCALPVLTDGESVGACMDMITVDEVVEAVRRAAG